MAVLTEREEKVLRALLEAGGEGAFGYELAACCLLAPREMRQTLDGLELSAYVRTKVHLTASGKRVAQQRSKRSVRTR